MQTANETIINVQEIEPRLRHQTIFNVFNTLLEGESLIIHNNHDPKPVYYQILDLRGNIFTWEYLQQGPEWWDIRVTRVVPILPNENNELILNIPAIQPQHKHATIFHIFDNIQQGDCFIIHNDHDPKPVYYQLVDKHGETFGWEYLQQGPNWWSIRVTKNEAAKDNKIAVQADVTVTTKENSDEIVINVPSLEPRLKHPTIFNTFENLAPGKSFIIHNDHDPKPVYYQLKSEHGDIFTWEYLQQGPQWWDIRVTKNIQNENEETIGQIVAKDIRKADVLKKYGIDFCCGGKKTVREVCAEKGIDANEVERELLKTTQNITIGNNLNYDEWNLDFLADYIVNTHHNFVRKYLPEIKGYAIKVAQVHGGRHEELIPIKSLVEEVHEELFEHMADEENNLFPVIKEIVKAKNANTPFQKEGKTFKEMVATTEAEHDSVGRAMEEIRRLSDNYAIPDDACTSYKLLFKLLQDFESDLFVHIHLENNILFTKAIDIEKSFA